MCVVFLIIQIAKNEYNAFEMKAINLTQRSQEMNENFFLTLAHAKQGKYSTSINSYPNFFTFI